MMKERSLLLSDRSAVLLILLLLASGGQSASSCSGSRYHCLFLSLGDNATAARHLLALTRRPHVAGTPADADTAAYVLAALPFPARVVSYDVLLSYPVDRSLVLYPSQPPSSGLATVFSLVQETYRGDPYADRAAEVLPTFHAYAHSGFAAGPVVYANYGRLEDFAALEAMGVNVTGAVVLAKYGAIYRGDIVRNAEDAGAVAAVVYTDAKDFGRGGTFPDGPGMPPSGVQVGSVYKGVGDPTTPGWPSTCGCERQTAGEVAASGEMPGIPSLPVSARDGASVQGSIGGKVAPDDWQGVERGPAYRLGPGPGFLQLRYTGNETLRTIHDVVAVIEGEEEPDRYVILGNHHDAWTFGAVDPNSGTATLLEMADRLAILQKKGWRPRRTIIICSWDAEEYGLIGSTEWVEENTEMLSSRAVAYLNVDVAVDGPGFQASATPQLDKLLEQATKEVQDPDNSSSTVYDSWISSNNGSSVIGRLGGGGSDFSAFIQHVGIPSADMTLGGAYPVYHSLYDDFVWMKKFGDPLFHRHVAAASILGLVALRLADEEFLPFDYTSYASELEGDTKKLEGKTKALGVPLSFAPLYSSIKQLKEAATRINDEIKALVPRKKKNALRVRELNDRLMMAERAFTDTEGLSGRGWYKHLIYGPSLRNRYGSKSFPDIEDAIVNAVSSNSSNSWRLAQHQLWRVSRVVTKASLVLNGKLT